MIKGEKKKKGFTLMEMLIVIAIIVILLAVAIPIFSTELDDGKNTVDAANLRSAKSVAVCMYLFDDSSFDGQYYDLETGTFTATKPESYAEGSVARGKVIQASIVGGEVTVNWVN